MAQTWADLSNKHWARLGEISTRHLKEFDTLYKQLEEETRNTNDLSPESLHQQKSRKLALLDRHRAELNAAVKKCHEEQIEFIQNEEAEKRLEERERRLEQENDLKEKQAEEEFQQEVQEQIEEEQKKEQSKFEELKARILRMKDQSKSLERDKDRER